MALCVGQWKERKEERTRWFVIKDCLTNMKSLEHGVYGFSFVLFITNKCNNQNFIFPFHVSLKQSPSISTTFWIIACMKKKRENPPTYIVMIKPYNRKSLLFSQLNQVISQCATDDFLNCWFSLCFIWFNLRMMGLCP